MVIAVSSRKPKIMQSMGPEAGLEEHCTCIVSDFIPY
jgi:hypothetical protein